jgi:hypothetical protein
MAYLAGWLWRLLIWRGGSGCCVSCENLSINGWSSAQSIGYLWRGGVMALARRHLCGGWPVSMASAINIGVSGLAYHQWRVAYSMAWRKLCGG